MWVDVLCTSVWVNALCINQSSKPDALRERERQVQMMARVLGSARVVTGDLGERPKYLDEMLKLFYIVASVLEERWKALKEGRKWLTSSNSYASAILFGYHIKSSSIGHGSGVFG
jgi:hypothetical protein